jgi:hypothetical protein
MPLQELDGAKFVYVDDHTVGTTSFLSNPDRKT